MSRDLSKISITLGVVQLRTLIRAIQDSAREDYTPTEQRSRDFIVEKLRKTLASLEERV